MPDQEDDHELVAGVIRTDRLRPGEVLTLGEQEVGAVPVRQDLTVLPADAPGSGPLGWKVYERDGCEVYRSLETMETVTSREGLKPGDVIYAPALTGGYYEAVVQRDDDGALCARSGEHTVLFLRFLDDPDKDDRAPVWITWGAANTRALRRLEISP